jgi:hypothetical protein
MHRAYDDHEIDLGGSHLPPELGMKPVGTTDPAGPGHPGRVEEGCT